MIQVHKMNMQWQAYVDPSICLISKIIPLNCMKYCIYCLSFILRIQFYCCYFNKTQNLHGKISFYIFLKIQLMNCYAWNEIGLIHLAKTHSCYLKHLSVISQALQQYISFLNILIPYSMLHKNTFLNILAPSYNIDFQYSISDVFKI